MSDVLYHGSMDWLPLWLFFHLLALCVLSNPFAYPLIPRLAAAAAYEAARADHFAQKSAEQQRRASGLGLGGLAGGGLGGMGMSVNPNQYVPYIDAEHFLRFTNFSSCPFLSLPFSRHYEMLKLHHMNLLNEIQETTLMMNLYQQQQLQAQQNQLAEQQSGMSSGGASSGNAGGNDSQISMLMQQNGGGNNQSMDNLFPGGSQLAQRNSLGLGGGSFSGLGDMAGGMSNMQSSGMQNAVFNNKQHPGADGTNQTSMKADGGTGNNTPAPGAPGGNDGAAKREGGEDPSGSPQAKRVKTEGSAEESKDAKA